MNAIKGIYNNGKVELIENPKIKEKINVIIIFPEKNKKIKKIRGLYKNYKFNYKEIKKELKNLNNNSTKHLIKEK